jgi:hypothetical protein
MKKTSIKLFWLGWAGWWCGIGEQTINSCTCHPAEVVTSWLNTHFESSTIDYLKRAERKENKIKEKKRKEKKKVKSIFC